MPMPSSRYTRSSVARLPAAPGAYGQPPVPPVDASKQLDPIFQPGDDVGEGGAARVVEVVGELVQRDAGARRARRQVVHLARHAHADGVAQADLVDAQLEQAQPDFDDAASVDAAGERAAERSRDVAALPPAKFGCASEHRRERVERAVDGHADVALGEGVTGRGENGQRVRRRRLRLGRGRARWARARGSARRRARQRATVMTWSASASCGMAAGETKLVASISVRPAARSSEMYSSLVSVGMGDASFCRPSRGPTS